MLCKHNYSFFCLDTKEPKSQDGNYYPQFPSEALICLLCYCGEEQLLSHEHPLCISLIDYLHVVYLMFCYRLHVYVVSLFLDFSF